MTDKPSTSEKDQEFVKGANENSVDVLIRRFKAGDPEVMYEKIQVCDKICLIGTSTIKLMNYDYLAESYHFARMTMSMISKSFSEFGRVGCRFSRRRSQDSKVQYFPITSSTLVCGGTIETPQPFLPRQNQGKLAKEQGHR